MALRSIICTSMVHVLFAQTFTCNDGNPCAGDTMVTTTGYVNCNTYHSCYESIIRQGSSIYDVYLNAQLAAQDADIVTHELDANYYQSAMGATISASYVYGDGEKSLQNAIITNNPLYSTALDVNLNADRSGYFTQISCASGESCDVACGDGACEETKFYCYSGATCSYHCDSNGVCPELIGGVESGLTDPQIYEIYLRNIENMPKPDGEPYTNDYYPGKPYKYVLSLTSSQFTLFLVVIALTVLLSVGLCLHNISTIKNNTKNLEKEVWA